MAERKSFVIYKDWEAAFSRLSNTQMGELFRALFAYMNQGQPYEGDDQVVGIAFDFARITLDRDNEKYQARCAANARNGQKGGRPRKDAETAANPPKTDGFANNAEESGEAAPLPPEPDVFFEEPEGPAAFAEYPPEPAAAAEEYPPEPQTDDRAFCAAAPSCTSAGAGASQGRSPEPPTSHGTYGAPSPYSAGSAGYPSEPAAAAEEYPPEPQTGDRAFCAAAPSYTSAGAGASRGRSQEPPTSHGAYGAPSPYSAGETERSFEEARRRAIQRLQREQFESYVPSRAAPTGGW